MSDELIIVKAARNYADDIDNDRGIEMGLPDCLREAANLIERLTAQVDGLQDEIKRLREQVRFASETDPAMRAEAAEAERDRTRADYEAMKAHNKELFGKLSAAEAERDRLAGEVASLTLSNDLFQGAQKKEAEVNTQLTIQLHAIRTERDRLKDALAPFAAIKADDGDTFDTWHDDVIIRCEITVRDLKQARAALGDAS